MEFALEHLQPTTMSANSTPISIENFRSALADLTDENIQSVLGQLNNSVLKLEETNEYLRKEITSNADPESNSLYEDTIRENLEVITNQKARVTAIEEELVKRGSKAASKAEDEGIYL